MTSQKGASNDRQQQKKTPAKSRGKTPSNRRRNKGKNRLGKNKSGRFRSKPKTQHCRDYDYESRKSYAKYCKEALIGSHGWTPTGATGNMMCSKIWHCINPYIYEGKFDFRKVCKRTCFKIRQKFYRESGNGDSSQNICPNSFQIDFQKQQGCNYSGDNGIGRECNWHGVYRVSQEDVGKC